MEKNRLEQVIEIGSSMDATISVGRKGRRQIDLLVVLWRGHIRGERALMEMYLRPEDIPAIERIMQRASEMFREILPSPGPKELRKISRKIGYARRRGTCEGRQRKSSRDHGRNRTQTTGPEYTVRNVTGPTQQRGELTEKMRPDHVIQVGRIEATILLGRKGQQRILLSVLLKRGIVTARAFMMKRDVRPEDISAIEQIMQQASEMSREILMPLGPTRFRKRNRKNGWVEFGVPVVN
jgi:hypothetical protein